MHGCFCFQLEDDSTLYVESFEHMLEAWVSVVHESTRGCLPAELCRDASVRIFDTYLQCHLGPPDGVRGVGEGQDDDEEEIEETEETDRIRYPRTCCIHYDA